MNIGGIIVSNISVSHWDAINNARSLGMRKAACLHFAPPSKNDSRGNGDGPHAHYGDAPCNINALYPL